MRITLATVLLTTATALAQGGPTTGPAPGFRVFGPHGTTETYMVDASGNIVHTWPSTYLPGNGLYLEDDGTLLRSGRLQFGPPIGGLGGAIQRIGFDGTVLWDFQYANAAHWGHHDIEPMPNGNVLLIAWDLMTRNDAISLGRDPALIPGGTWYPDSVVEIEQTGPTSGRIVWEWHVRDHLIQDFDASKPNFGSVAANPERIDINFPRMILTNGDFNHANQVDYDPIKDIVILNVPFQNEYWFIDHSTTTAEAAGSTGGNYGKGGDLIYRWGNPQAYGAGGPADQRLFAHHGTHVIPTGMPGAGNILCFNNRAGTPVGLNYSSVMEISVPASFALQPGQAWGPTGVVWQYTAPNPTELFSGGLSHAERLPNGNTLIVSGRQNGWMFEVTPAKQKVWEYFNTQPAASALVFQVSYYERQLWSREDRSGPGGRTVHFDMVAGSDQAGLPYMLVGSATGTAPGFEFGGVHLPLNVDLYTSFTIAAAGSVALPGSAGLLDAMGNGSARLVLPSSTPPGITLHHAFFVFDPATDLPVLASNAVPTILP